MSGFGNQKIPENLEFCSVSQLTRVTKIGVEFRCFDLGKYLNQMVPIFIDKPEGGTRLVGDVDFDSCAEVAGAISPVPGGVGPMTIACLLANTVTACCRANGLSEPDGLTA